jgi:hypothetical protein
MDNVVRKVRFENANPGVRFTVERSSFLTHRAAWIDTETGVEEAISSISLGHLMSELEERFKAQEQQ